MEKPRKIFESVVTADIKMKKQVFKIVKRRGMQGVVNEKSGTAYGSRIENVHMSGKTELLRTTPVQGKTSATMRVHFAQSEDPAVAISVLVEYGGHGSSQAAPSQKQFPKVFFVVKPEIKEAICPWSKSINGNSTTSTGI